jgi:hypothetical protein
VDISESMMTGEHWNRSHKPSLSTRWNDGTRLVVGSHTCSFRGRGSYETGSMAGQQSADPAKSIAILQGSY